MTSETASPPAGVTTSANPEQTDKPAESSSERAAQARSKLNDEVGDTRLASGNETSQLALAANLSNTWNFLPDLHINEMISNTADAISQVTSNAVGAVESFAHSDDGEKVKNIANQAIMLSNPLTASYDIQSKNIEMTDSLAQSMSDDGVSGSIKQALLAGNEITKLGQTFEHATAYSAIQSPVSGIEQLLNWGLKSSNLPTLPPLEIVDALPEAEFNTPQWYAQTAGTGAGIVVGFAATEGLGTGAMALGRAGQAVEITEAAIGTSRLAVVGEAAAKLPLIQSLSTGFAYGTIAMPVADANATDFIQQRLKNGVVTAVSGALVQFGGEALGQIAADTLPNVSQSIIRPVSNAFAGYGTGIVNAEMTTLLAGHGLTLDLEELHKQAMTWAVMGAGSEAAGTAMARSGAGNTQPAHMSEPALEPTSTTRLNAEQTGHPLEPLSTDAAPVAPALESLKITYQGLECEVLYVDNKGAIIKRNINEHPARIMQYIQQEDLAANYQASEVSELWQDSAGVFFRADPVPNTQQILLTRLPEISRVSRADLLQNTDAINPAQSAPSSQESLAVPEEAISHSAPDPEVAAQPSPHISDGATTDRTHAEILERTADIFEKINAGEIAPSYFDPIVASYPEADRDLAQAIVNESMSKVVDLDLMDRARALNSVMQDELARLNLPDYVSSGIIAHAASEGAFTGYVWRKANKLGLNLYPLESEIPGGHYQGDASFFFDDPSKLSASELSKVQALAQERPLFFLDLGNYEASLNGLDIGLGPEAVKAKLDNLVDSGHHIKEAHPDWTPEQITHELLYGERDRAIQALGPNAHLLEVKSEDMQYGRRPITPEAVANFVETLKPEVQREAMKMMSSMDYKTFASMANESILMKEMVDEAAQLRGIDVESEPPPYYVSGTELYGSDAMSSDGMLNYIYRYANNIPEEQFLSKSQLLKMQENGELTYTAPDGTQKNRRVIVMDDTVYSGLQIDNSLSNLAEIQDLSVLTLGMYSRWEKDFLAKNRSTEAMGAAAVREILPLKTNFSMRTIEDPGLGAMTPEDIEARKQLVDDCLGVGKMGSFQIFPYMTSDNSIKFIARFARDVMGIRSARRDLED